MPIATRLTSNGTYYVNGSFDEVGWTPAELGSSLALWLDAADSSTVILNGSTVSQWRDKSGNGRHVSQATSTRQPTYNATGLNGKPTLSFDGNNDSLKNATYEPAGAVSAFVVFNRNATKGTLLNVQRSGGIFEITGKFNATYKTVTLTARGGVSPSFGFDIVGDGVNQNNILGVQHNDGTNTAANFTGHWNGDLQTIVNSGGLGFLSETGFSVGGRPVQDLLDAYYPGLISEIIFRNSTTTTADRQRLEGYLAHKWGLTANLPADHPYKTSPPSSTRVSVSADTVRAAEFDELNWTPANITTALWLDAADASTVILNGSTVSQWNDKSGNGSNVAQNTAADQPTYQLTGLNGNPTLFFDGTDALIRNTQTLPTNASIFFAISYNNAALSLQNVMSSQPTTGTTPRFYIQADAGTLRGYSSIYFPAGPYTAGVPEITNFSVQTGLSEMYRNGTLAGSMASSAGVNNGLLFGGLVSNFGTPARMSLSEVVVFSGNPSTADRQRVEGYLAWKWGLAADLPSDHPYKSAAPSLAQEPGIAKRELSTGVLQVSGEFDEFTGAPVVDSSLVLWLDAAQPASYPGTGSSWNNLSPASGTVTLYNSPTFDGNNSGGALSFSPASLQYGDNNANLGNMPNFTVEAWAKVTASLTGQVTAIVTNQFNLSTALNFSIGTNNAPTNYNLVAGFYDGSWRNSSATGFNPTLNQWYHFVGTYDGSTLRFYVDGSLHSSLSYSGTPASGGTIRIARRWDDAPISTNLFPGEIGVVRIYNRALVPDEIATNFNAHRNRYGI